MTEKTYKVKVYRTVHQRAFVEVCTNINPEGQAFYDIVDEEVFQLEDNEWDTIETDGSGFFDILNAKVV